MEIIFFTSIIIIFYIFIGYPVMIFLLARFFPKIISRNIPDRLPSVSIIIAAYNEEKIIKEKLQNTCTLDYPKDLLEIMVVSDGSTDRTDHIVQEFQPQGVQLIRVEGRKGKTECQNQAVKRATGEIIIFSDANSIYDPMSVRYIVENFSDPTVGGGMWGVALSRRRKNQ